MNQSLCIKPEQVPRMTRARLSAHARASLRDHDRKFKYQAARRALAIVNTLPHGDFRKKHVSRIFRNLNKLRVA